MWIGAMLGAGPALWIGRNLGKEDQRRRLINNCTTSAGEKRWLDRNPIHSYMTTSLFNVPENVPSIKNRGKTIELHPDDPEIVESDL